MTIEQRLDFLRGELDFVERELMLELGCDTAEQVPVKIMALKRMGILTNTRKTDRWFELWAEYNKCIEQILEELLNDDPEDYR